MQRDIWVDFNAVDAACGWLQTLAHFAEPGTDLSIGAKVVVGDDDGNFCQATVLEVSRNGVVRLSVDMDTFNTAPAAEYAAMQQ